MIARRGLLSCAGALALAGAALPLAGCWREVSDATEDDDRRGIERLPAGATLSLGGVRPGDTRADLAGRLEEVPTDLPRPTAARYRADGDFVHVTFDAPGPQGRAREIFGPALRADGRTVLAPGHSTKAVQAALGAGERKEHRRPSGSGVISFGTDYAGEEWLFRRADGDWTFHFDKDRRLGGIVVRARSAGGAPAPTSKPAG